MRLIALISLAASAIVPAGAETSLPESVRGAASAVDWTPARVDELIEKMPKVETHLHLDGSVTPEMIQKLAAQQKYAPLAGKSVEEIAALSVVSKTRDSLAEVLRSFGTVYPLLRTPQAVEEIAYDLARREAAQNVRAMEVRFAPVLQSTAGFTSEQVLQSTLRGLKRGEKDFGVQSGVIICLIRPAAFVSLAQNEEMLKLAIDYKKRGVVGIDLAGNEAAQPLSDYADLYRRALKSGLSTTAHAGEVAGGKDIDTALALGVQRLGHAIELERRPDLLAEVVRRRIPIEVNLTSNLRTSAVPDYASHPVKGWFAAGIPIELSSDDPGVFGIDINHEYRALAHDVGFSPIELLTVSFQGVDGMFLPAKQKKALRRSFESELLKLLQGLKRSQ